MAGGRWSLGSVSASFFTSIRRWWAAPLLAVVLLAGVAASQTAPLASAASNDLMCGITVQQRTQNVAISPDLAAAGVTYADVVAAFQPWNNLFMRYYGFPIFAEYTGYAQDADIVVTAAGAPRTWVETRCIAGFAQQGNVHSIVHLGYEDYWRNLTMLPHELGHTLGFADFGTTADLSSGHYNYRPCDGSYIGVMSYCTSPQAWFLDLGIPGIRLDGDLVRTYWQ
ncbi:MAG TPA: hypothetical protein VFY10_03300 [Dehalococcoidia bacterium]|nr:hypothetical protein [Dehalococcoidia bacterium]